MSMRPVLHTAVPEETARLARASFPKGHPYLTLRDTLGPLFDDQDFADLYAHQGPAGISPARLAVITLLQFHEDLSDEEVADAVRSRLDWKYLLALPADDAGFDASVLTEFRARLRPHDGAMRLLDRVLAHAQSRGLLRKRGMQRTDSTHVLAAVRRLNRLQLVHETMRHVLDALALVAPTWLQSRVDRSWADRYGSPFTRGRLPKGEAARQALAEAIGQDGFALLAAIDAADAPPVLRGLEAVQTLRRIWAQQYVEGEDGPHFRPSAELAPAAELECSPYDADARFCNRHELGWTGYLLHLTETCDPDLPSLVLGVETTAATTPDGHALAPIQAQLAARDHLPGTQLADSGYVTAAALVQSQEQGITLVGPMQKDSSWQARAGAGYTAAAFSLDWDQQQATCPQGKSSSTWRPITTASGQAAIQIHFRMTDCQPCPARAACTQADRRSLTVWPRPAHEARLQAQAAETTRSYHQTYRWRAGIEGTISVAVRAAGARRARTRGLVKVRMEHVFIGASINFGRLAAWFQGMRPAATRQRPFQRLMAAPAFP
jgi:transposase